MLKKDKTPLGVIGSILAFGGFIASIAFAVNQQTFFIIISGVIVILGIIFIAYAVKD